MDYLLIFFFLQSILHTISVNLTWIMEVIEQSFKLKKKKKIKNLQNYLLHCLLVQTYGPRNLVLLNTECKSVVYIKQYQKCNILHTCWDRLKRLYFNNGDQILETTLSLSEKNTLNGEMQLNLRSFQSQKLVCTK